MSYRQELAHEYQQIRNIEAKLERARAEGKQAAIQVFEALETSTWKAIGDLERLVEIFEK